jgi:hypothetical protein
VSEAAVREATLLHGYSGTRGLDDTRIEERSCACGGVVRADPAAPARGVAQHNSTGRHRAWRANREELEGHG